MIICSIGICIYNEEKNLPNLLRSLSAQRTNKSKIGEIIIISSGTTDNSHKIISEYKKKEKRIVLFTQKKREGKASALNYLITKAKYNVIVLFGGDMILKNNTIEKLVTRFEDNGVGMTGGHPIPVNNINDGLTGFAAHLLWELHHQISLKTPKMGEVIAFRKIFKRIPTTGADEASIEPLIRGQGYRIEYVPEAVIHNKAPTTIKEFINQRRRNYWLHLAVKYEQYYEVSTLRVTRIMKALIRFLLLNPRPKYLFYASIVILLESYSRLVGLIDYKVRKRKYGIWETITTTKYGITPSSTHKSYATTTDLPAT